jgi:type VI secretion system protein VasG
MLPELSSRILSRLAEGGEVGRVKVAMGEGDTFQYDIG